MTTNVPYRASQDSKAMGCFRGNDLIVQGIIIDQIDGRGTCYTHRVFEDESLIQSVH